MPSVGEYPIHRVRAFCEQTEATMRPPILTDEERDNLHASDVDPDDRTKDDWWKRYTEVRSYLRRKEFQSFQKQQDIDEGPILSVVANDPIEVELSDGSLKQVYMASYDRIMLVENYDFLIKAIQIARTSIMEDILVVDDFHAMLDRLREEEVGATQMLLAQVCAPGPEPLDLQEVPEWCSKLIPEDGKALLSAWLTVNVERPAAAERVIRAKWPTKKESKDRTGKDSLGGFSFLFLSVSWREMVPVHTIMKDRALAGILVQYLTHGQEEKHLRQKAEADRPNKKNKR